MNARVILFGGAAILMLGVGSTLLGPRTEQATKPVAFASAADSEVPRVVGAPPAAAVAVEPSAVGAGETPTSPAVATFSVGEEIGRLEEAMANQDVSVLRRLREASLDEHPEVASTIIRSVGHLATSASPAERDASARTLARWLLEERMKPSTFARGNVSLLVDALADAGSREGVSALAEALDARSLPLHIETKIVQALAAIGDPRGIAPIRRFSARVEAMPVGTGNLGSSEEDKMQRELVEEAARAASDAIERLPS